MKRFKDFTADEMRLLNSMWSDASEQWRLKFARQVGNSAGSIHRELANYRRYAKLFGRDKGEPSMKPKPVSVPRQAPPPKVVPKPAPQAMDTETITKALRGCVPQFQIATYGAPLTVETDTAIVTGDWHLPRFHWRLWIASVYIAKAINAKHYFIVGDMRDNNQTGITPWLPSWQVNEPTGDQVADLLMATVQRTRLATGCNLYACDGNHDKWHDKNSGGQFWFSRNLARVKGVTATRLHYMNMVTRHGTVRLSHPRGSGVLLSLPRRMRERLHPDKHVLCAHTHKLGMGINAGYWVIENGGMFWRDAMQYVHEEEKAMEQPEPGFSFFVDGDPYIVSEYHSMRFYLGRKLNTEYEKHWRWFRDNMLGGYYKPVRHTVGAAA